MIWEAAVGFMSCIPWKYPRKEAMSGTNSKAGAMDIMAYFAPGFLMAFTMTPAPKNKMEEEQIPMAKEQCKRYPKYAVGLVMVAHGDPFRNHLGNGDGGCRQSPGSERVHK